MFGDNPPQDFVYPDCDKDGYFKPRQCFPLAGCHCYDKYGSRIDCEKSDLLRWGTKPLPPGRSPTFQRTMTGKYRQGRFLLKAAGSDPLRKTSIGSDRTGFLRVLSAPPDQKS